MSDLKIEYKEVKDIIPYVNNSRTHSDEQITQIAASIHEFGFTNPILLDGDNGIIAGHGRLLAAKKLGMDEVPTIDLSYFTEAQKRAYIIADNQLALNAGWDEELLKIELQELDEMDFDLDLMGFDDDFMDGLDGDVEGKWDDDEKSEFNLADRFIVPPFSVLNTTRKDWLDLRHEWDKLGINSGGGRNSGMQKGMNVLQSKARENGAGAMGESDDSIFDPVLAQLMYHWFNIEGGSILDPFAGGSVRGIVAKKMGYDYTGFDIRQEQIDFNIENCSDIGVSLPNWICDDSLNIDNHVNEKVDMVFSCPPYADLEVYSDMSNDLSNMSYEDFIETYSNIIKKSCDKLKFNRFAVFVVGEIRDKKGMYRNFVGDTVKAFIDSGLSYYNELILVNSTGSAALRVGKYMKRRKPAKIHQNVLVFYKGENHDDIVTEFKELNDKYEIEN